MMGIGNTRAESTAHRQGRSDAMDDEYYGNDEEGRARRRIWKSVV